VSGDCDRNGLLDACEPPACPADITHDGLVSGDDLAVLLASWSLGAASGADVDGSGLVDGGDLAALLGGWGPCP
jgi:hypothetical protein